jgi:hypothetical protein
MLGEELQHTGCRPSPFKEIVEAHGAMSLGEAVTVRPEDKWHMGVRQRVEAELSAKPHLARRGQQEVIGPHHLLDTLRGIIDDNSQVVGENAVISNQDQVVHDRFHGAAHRVDKPKDGGVGPNPQGRTSTSIHEALPRMLAELTTRTGVGAIGKRRTVGGRGGLSNLAARAKTRIGKTELLQCFYSFDVVVGSIRLKDDGAIPVEPERSKVVQLSTSEITTRHCRVEIFHAHHKPPTRCPGRKPRSQRSAKVAEMQRAGRAGREATVQPGTGADA